MSFSEPGSTFFLSQPTPRDQGLPVPEDLPTSLLKCAGCPWPLWSPACPAPAGDSGSPGVPLHAPHTQEVPRPPFQLLWVEMRLPTGGHWWAPSGVCHEQAQDTPASVGSFLCPSA